MGLRTFTFSKALFVLLALVMAVSFPLSVYAVEDTEDSREDFYSTNDILYYDENFTDFCATGGMTLYGADNLQKLYNFFLDKGLSEVQAAGAIGNIAHESIGAKDPFVVERNDKHPELPKSTQKPSELPVVDGWAGGGGARQPGWGLIQWTPASKFVGIAEKVGVSEPYDLAAQAEVIWWHMENETPTSFRKFNDTYRTITEIEAATRYFMDNMEAPEIKAFPDRLAAAELALKYGPAPGSSTTGSGCVGNAAIAGDAIKTALAYAHPTYTKPNHFDMTPAYTAAVKSAQEQMKYVGGLQHPGIDCNGFISRVMEDSGVDPTYNSTADGKSVNRNTVAQLEYLKSSDKYEQYDPETAGGVTPGSIGINSKHVYMYIGEQPGLETQVVSASYGGTSSRPNWRAPMAGMETPGDPDFEWFRLK